LKTKAKGEYGLACCAVGISGIALEMEGMSGRARVTGWARGRKEVTNERREGARKGGREDEKIDNKD